MPSSTPLIDRLQGMNLYLIGMMGSGKSTLGKLLAAALHYQFFDTDTLIEQVANQSIPRLFEQEGELAFRTLETQVLARLCPYQRLVVATGGGIVTKQENWSYLQQGLVIWLDVPLTHLYDRLCADSQCRPLLQTADPLATLETLMELRFPLYSQADLKLACHDREENPAQILERLLHAIPSVLKS